MVALPQLPELVNLTLVLDEHRRHDAARVHHERRVSNDGETMALVRAGAGGAFTLELLGQARARVNVGPIDRWTRVSMNEALVVLGRSAYAREDLARRTIGEELIARSNGATRLRWAPRTPPHRSANGGTDRRRGIDRRGSSETSSTDVSSSAPRGPSRVVMHG